MAAPLKIYILALLVVSLKRSNKQRLHVFNVARGSEHGNACKCRTIIPPVIRFRKATSLRDTAGDATGCSEESECT